jgi:arylsulfatase A-like enzyme
MKKNIILIVIDALRARNLGCYGARNPLVSPNIDALAGRGILFEKAFATWNTTDQSLTTILTGKYPLCHGITNHGDQVTTENLDIFYRSGTKTLPQILHPYGYRTYAIDWMKRWFKKGFDFYGYDTDIPLTKKVEKYVQYIYKHRNLFKNYLKKRTFSLPHMDDIIGTWRTFWFTKELPLIQDAALMTNSGIRCIRSNKNAPFFLFLHYWDTHTPYHASRESMKKIKADKRNTVDTYKAAIHYVDTQIGRLIKALKNKNILNNTIVVITSDHGESLTEHGIYFDHHGLYDETIHVPLIIYDPAIKKAPACIGGFVQHVDLLPTLFEMIDIDPPIALDGQSLVHLWEKKSASSRPFAYTEESYVQKKRAIRTDRYKYIAAKDDRGFCKYCKKVHQGKEELYDLFQDPRELKNLVLQEPEIAKKMAMQLDQFVSQLIEKRQRAMQSNLGDKDCLEQPDSKEREEVTAKLQGLGYLD